MRESRINVLPEVLLVGFMLAVGCPLAAAQVVDFADIELASESTFAGPTENSESFPDGFGGMVHIGTFESGGVSFLNHAGSFGLSKGFAVSNRTDTTTEGFTSGTSAITGGGFGESDDNYAVAFGYRDLLDPTDISQLAELSWFDVPSGAGVVAAQVTNTTYGALSMQTGDSFAKSFGGLTGDDPDFFELTIYGSQGESALDESVSVMLADYRSEDNSEDYILTEWTAVDLSPLAAADRIYFNLNSSDIGMFGMNTPAYFAIDEIELATSPSPLDELDRLCQSVVDGTASLDVVDAWLSDAGLLNGDADLNGVVEFPDFLTLSANYGSGEATWSQGEFDCDGEVGFTDFLLLSENFSTGERLAAVPEPSTLWLLLMAMLGGLRMLRRPFRRLR